MIGTCFGQYICISADFSLLECQKCGEHGVFTSESSLSFSQDGATSYDEFSDERFVTVGPSWMHRPASSANWCLWHRRPRKFKPISSLCGVSKMILECTFIFHACTFMHLLWDLLGCGHTKSMSFPSFAWFQNYSLLFSQSKPCFDNIFQVFSSPFKYCSFLMELSRCPRWLSPWAPAFRISPRPRGSVSAAFCKTKRWPSTAPWIVGCSSSMLSRWQQLGKKMKKMGERKPFLSRERWRTCMNMCAVSCFYHADIWWYICRWFSHMFAKMFVISRYMSL